MWANAQQVQYKISQNSFSFNAEKYLKRFFLCNVEKYLKTFFLDLKFVFLDFKFIFVSHVSIPIARICEESGGATWSEFPHDFWNFNFNFVLLTCGDNLFYLEVGCDTIKTKKKNSFLFLKLSLLNPYENEAPFVFAKSLKYRF